MRPTCASSAWTSRCGSSSSSMSATCSVEPGAADPGDPDRLDRRQRPWRDCSLQGRLVRPWSLSRLAVPDQHPVLLPSDLAAVHFWRPAGAAAGGRCLLVRPQSGVLVGLLCRRHYLLLVTVLVAGVGVYRRSSRRYA